MESQIHVILKSLGAGPVMPLVQALYRSNRVVKREPKQTTVIVIKVGSANTSSTPVPNEFAHTVNPNYRGISN
jgi:hypothetical protein